MILTLPSGQKIGDGQPAFIIAEIGSNWIELDDCWESIRLAAQAGADAVKFQLYDPLSLYGYWPDGSQIAGVLNPKWLPLLKNECQTMGIEFMCSAFSPELVDQVDPYVNLHKVASAECNHLRILEKLREKGKPVFLSTGAHGKKDIEAALEVLGSTPVIPFYCVSSYPARNIDLFRIQSLQGLSQGLVGYSDHSTDIQTIPPLSIYHGACAIEKHVKFVPLPFGTPDSEHSLTHEEFKEMVFHIRAQKYGGVQRIQHLDEFKGFTSEEKPMLLRHNRRLIAIREVSEGETFKEGHNFGIYRSLVNETKALHPFAVNDVQDQQSKTHLKPGEGIGPFDVDLKPQ